MKSSFAEGKTLMLQIEVKKILLLIGLGGILLCMSIAVISLINTHFWIHPFNVAEIVLFWFFLIGCVIFPNAFRRYQTERERRERKDAWYHYPGLIICLLGLLSGLLVTLSIIHTWILSSNRLPSDIGLEAIPPRTMIGLDPFFSILGANGHFSTLMITAALLNLCWVVLALFLIAQVIKRMAIQMYE